MFHLDVEDFGIDMHHNICIHQLDYPLCDEKPGTKVGLELDSSCTSQSNVDGNINC